MLERGQRVAAEMSSRSVVWAHTCMHAHPLPACSARSYAAGKDACKRRIQELDANVSRLRQGYLTREPPPPVQQVSESASLVHRHACMYACITGAGSHGRGTECVEYTLWVCASVPSVSSQPIAPRPTAPPTPGQPRR